MKTRFSFFVSAIIILSGGFHSSLRAADADIFEALAKAAGSIQNVTYQQPTLVIPSQTTSSGGLFGRFIRRVAPRVPTTVVVEVPHPVLAPLSRQIAGHTQVLRTLASAHPLPPSYADSLRVTTEALGRVGSDRSLPEDVRVNISRFSEQDLAAKASYAQRNPTQPFQEIPVSVWTVKGTEQVAGCEVWHLPVAWKDDMSRAQRFHQLSSPTTKALPPGYYMMWTVQDGRSGKALMITVDEQITRQRLDLAAPVP